MTLALLASAALLPAAASAAISTGDGGWFWQNPLPQGNSLNAVTFTDSSHGWAVGSSGTILATSNGGATWTAQNAGATDWLDAVAFTDASHGWAVGNNGTILATSNGGAAWTAQSSGTTNWLGAVAFTDSSHGWAVGDNGTILATTTGGFAPGSDHTAPTTTATGADALWHRSAVTVTLAATDNSGGSGMTGGSAKTEYKLDSGAWTTGTSCTVAAPADHTKDGLHTVGYRSTDAAGNVEAARSVTVKIDTTAPAVTLSGAASGAWYRSARTLTCTASDAASGVKTITSTLDGAAVTVNGATASRTVATLPNARHSFSYVATDAAGNTSLARTLAFTIDSSGPVTYAKAASGYRYRAIKLYYKTTDNLSSRATGIKIVVKNSAGKVVKSFYPTAKQTAAWYYVKWTPGAKGTYRYYISARDLAGNAQRIRGYAKVVVR